MVEYLANAPDTFWCFLARVGSSWVWFARHASLLGPLVVLPLGMSLSGSPVGYFLVFVTVFPHHGRRIFGKGRNTRYINLVKLNFCFLMVFILFQSDIYWESYGVLKFLVYKKSKIFVLWPKYVMILYNYDKNGYKIVSIWCIIRGKLHKTR